MINFILVNTIFGATKVRTDLKVFEGANSEDEVHFFVSNLFFHNHHHMVKQNITGQGAHQVFIKTAENLANKYNL